MKTPTNKLNPEWVRELREAFKSFLDETGFPHPERNGTRGSRFDYPEWLIMLIAILSVKCKIKSYLGIHEMAMQYWDILTEGLKLEGKRISESNLRDRLKKICHTPGKPAAFIFQVFPEGFLD